MSRAVSVSLAPYDGYDLGEALDSLARCGAQAAEPAFIVGYTEPFDEAAFTPDMASAYRVALRLSGLSCFSMSSHIDLGRPDAVPVFTARMDFARAIGASVIATNAAVRANEDAFWRNIEPLARHAENIGLAIGLENPGDGRPNLIDTAVEGLAVVGRINSPCVRLNYDPGNTASHLPGGPNPAEDAVRALPGCIHMHLKDVRRASDGWFFTPIGEGDIDCARVLEALAKRPELSFSIELPLRIHRGVDAQPLRRAVRVPLAEIESAIKASLRRVKEALDKSRSFEMVFSAAKRQES